MDISNMDMDISNIDVDIDSTNNTWSHAETAFTMKRLIQQKYCTNTDNCMICLDSMTELKGVYLPCKHLFHYKCLMLLIENETYTCPLCRTDFKDAMTLLGMRHTSENISNPIEHIIDLAEHINRSEENVNNCIIIFQRDISLYLFIMQFNNFLF